MPSGKSFLPTDVLLDLAESARKPNRGHPQGNANISTFATPVFILYSQVRWAMVPLMSKVGDQRLTPYLVLIAYPG